MLPRGGTKLQRRSKTPSFGTLDVVPNGVVWNDWHQTLVDPNGSQARDIPRGANLKVRRGGL
jgi:hypothetical protein